MPSLIDENRIFRGQRTSNSSSSSSDSGIKLSEDVLNSYDSCQLHLLQADPAEPYTFYYSLKAEPMTHFIIQVSLYPKQTNKKFISAIIHFPGFNNHGKSKTTYKNALCLVPHQKHKPKITSKMVVSKPPETKETFRSDLRLFPKDQLRISSPLLLHFDVCET